MPSSPQSGPSGPHPPAGCDWPIVLGIDPGTRVVGYGAVVVAPDRARLLAAGVLSAPARAAVPQRLARIQSGLVELLEEIRPGAVVVERVFTAKNSQSALRIGEGRGVILACAAARGLEVAEVAPAAAKKAVAGSGQASKEQVARTLEAILEADLGGLDLDATDALALALAHVKRLEFARATARPAGPRREAGTPPGPGARSAGGERGF